MQPWGAYHGNECAIRPGRMPRAEVLEGRYRADFKVYLAAVRSLEHPLRKEEFHEIYQNAELAKRAFENARETLDAHIASHGCSTNEPL
jgi:hypothetical protein